MYKYFKKIVSILFFISCVFYTPKVYAATLTVTSRSDSGAGTLRNQIIAAADGDTIVFNLASGYEAIALSSTLTLSSNKSIIIDGANTAGSGTRITVQVGSPSNSTYPVFYATNVGAAKTVTLKNMTLRGGTAGTGSGGTIFFYTSGTLVVDTCTVKDGRGRFGAGLWANGFNGLTITNSIFQDNYTSETGGAARIDSFSSTVTITGSTFNNNRSTAGQTNSYGAALYFQNNSAYGTVNIDKTTFSNNIFTDSSGYGSGGAIYASNMVNFTITNSTFNNNSAAWSNGAISVNATNTTLTNNTFASNTTKYGGNVNISGTLHHFTNNTIVSNTASGNTYDGVYLSSGTAYFQNNLIANNGSGGSDTDFYRGGGTAISNGYNIVEYSGNKTWNSTGDISGNQANLNIGATLADNSGLNGVKTLALLVNSVAINAGNATANNTVSIPSNDQRGFYRTGQVDIGAYEYDGTSSATYTLSYSSDVNGSLTGSTAQTVSAGTNGTAVSAVANAHYHFLNWSDGSNNNPRTDLNVASSIGVTANFTIDTYVVTYAAGANGSISGNATQTVDWGGDATQINAVADSAYHFTNWSDGSTLNPRQDQNVTEAISVTANFVANDTSAPVIVDVDSAPASRSATITWTTDEIASSKVQYGLNTAYGFSTAELDTAPRMTSHSINLTNLTSCARYYYRVISKDATNNQAVSAQKTFNTSGCVTSTVVNGNENLLALSGGSVSLVNHLSTALINVPDNYATQQATFQLNKLESTSAPSGPSGKTIASGNFYDLVAVTTTDQQLAIFDKPITFTVSYGADIETDFDESTLDVYKYDGANWIKKNCTLDMVANTLTCSLSGFSVYGVLGSIKGTGTTTSETSNIPVNDPFCHNFAPAGISDLFQINVTDTTATLYFTPVSDAGDYYISFSDYEHADQYGANVTLAREGVQNYQVFHLKPSSTYYFKVRGGNGCAAGRWSNILKARTNMNGVVKHNNFYKNLITPVLTNTPTVLGESTKQIIIDKKEDKPQVKTKILKKCFLWWCM